MTEPALVAPLPAVEPAPVPSFKPPWIEECCRLLAVWWEAGFSATAVTLLFAEAGFSFTRNAIIGKVHRLQLPPHQVLPGPRRPAKPRRSVLVTRRAARAEVGEALTELPPEIVSHPVTFAALQDRHCRWPLDDGQFCGADRSWRADLNGEPFRSSYCAGHHARAYYPPRNRHGQRIT